MKRTIFLTLVALALLPLPATAAETFNLDTSHTRIGFGVTHMVVATVRGSFGEFSGSVEVDLENLTASSVDVTIEAASVDTGQTDRDEHLRSADFFDVENHPQILFESTGIERQGDEIVVAGDLTIRGVTRSVRMPVEVRGPVEDPWGNTRLGISGNLTIDRTDFGLNYNRVLEAGGLVVGQEVRIEIDAELVRRGE